MHFFNRLLILAATSLCISQATCSPVAQKAGLSWAYIRGKASYYYMVGDQASWRYTTRGKFDFIPEGGSLISIRTLDNMYLKIDGTGLLVKGASASERAIFNKISSPENGPNAFYLSKVGSADFLVTPNNQGPFNFYLSSLFPAEQMALFTSSDYDSIVETTYNRTRANIIPTVKMIQESSSLDKAVAYSQLIWLMNEVRHDEGKEIFYVGKAIFEDLGDTSHFSGLPSVVTTLFHAGPLAIYWYDEWRSPYRLRYNWAYSDPVRDDGTTLPYTMTYEKSSQLWSITYGEFHQLTTNSTSKSGPLTQVVSRTGKDFSFVVYYEGGRVKIFAQANSTQWGVHESPIVAGDAATNVYFEKVEEGYATQFDIMYVKF